MNKDIKISRSIKEMFSVCKHKLRKKVEFLKCTFCAIRIDSTISFFPVAEAMCRFAFVCTQNSVALRNVVFSQECFIKI